jgi:hypothetical protein
MENLMSKVILYELNEVPWCVVDTFVKKYPTSTLASILKESIQYTTTTKDSGELHPWTTWPTLHRGVYNDTHDIRFLNQDITTNYKPTWELVAEKGIATGVFGSLQSWPIPKEGNYSFYIPDTFSKDPQTFPKKLECFQRFNLAQTKKDAGVVAGGVSIGIQSIKDLFSMIQNGLTGKTILLLMRQLVREILNKNFKHIRSIYQSPVAFDLFFRILKEKKPAYTTFFTNHAAGMMHRYWKYLYPEEFNYKLKTNDDYFRSHAILRAMEITEMQLKKLKDFADSNNYTIIIASSMGQEAIDRGEFLGQIHIRHMDKFYQAIQFEGLVKNNLAMSPDFAFEFETTNDLEQFQNAVLNLTDSNGTPVFGFKRSGLTLNINIQTTAALVRSGGLYRDQKREKISFEDLGISVEPRDVGTGYHQPKGIGIFYKKGLKPLTDRSLVESIQVAPTILSLFNISPPSYMQEPLQEAVGNLKDVI